MPTPTQIAIDHIRATEDAARHLYEEVEMLRSLVYRSVLKHGHDIEVGVFEIPESLEFSFDDVLEKQTKEQIKAKEPRKIVSAKVQMIDPVKLGLGSRRVDILTRAGLITPEKPTE